MGHISEDSGSFWEWVFPSAFVVCMGWTIWHMPGFILDLIPPSSESLYAQISELHVRKDVLTEISGVAIPKPFGGFADAVDWLALILVPILFFFGARTVRCAGMEFADWRPIDRFALFIGRVTMVLILGMTLVMLYEVFLRYFLEKPTLWANELTLWIAGFVFLCSGLYAMQQRCHIRIFIFYDMVPRWLQRVFDVISVALLVIFAFFLVYGSYKQVFVTKFYRWEMFGTAFDPPIPATLQPMILIIVVLIAVQAIVNLISDWNLEKVIHTAADDIDEEELKAIKRAVGVD